MSNYRPSQGYGAPAQDPYGQRPGSTTYGGQQQQQQQQQAGGYATPPPQSSQWPQPPPNPPHQQSQYQALNAAPQGQQPAAPAYNPGVYGQIPGSQQALPGPPPIPQPYHGQQPPQASHQQPHNYGGQAQAGPPPAQQFGHSKQSSVASVHQPYQGEPSQNAQNWPQHPQYSTHAPVDRYGPGQPQVHQQSQHEGVPQRPNYDISAPPPPSGTPGGSYFPPSNQSHPNQPSGPPPTSAPGVPLSASSTYSQDDGNSYDIPPSLSGEGVAAYIPTNTNPAPGVYIPPPPESVPAWSQRPHDPLDPNFKKFQYTPRPPPKPQEYGNQPPAGIYNNAQTGQNYPPPPPPQAPPSMQAYGQQTQQQQQQHQPYSTPGPDQQQSQGMPYSQAPPQNQYQPVPGQPQYQQQAQNSPAQAYTAPAQSSVPPGHYQAWNAQGQHPGSRPGSTQQGQQPYLPPQHGHSSSSSQGQHPGSRPGSVQQAQQPYIPPQHGHSSSISQAQYNQPQRLYQEEQTPVSPLQSRQSMSMENPNDPRHSISGIPSRSESQASLKSVPLRPIQDPKATKPAVGSTNASALGGFGGPSDWEHFGLGADEIDDTAMYGAKSDDKAPPSSHMASVELPTGSPVRGRRSDSEVSAPDDWQPSSTVAPLNSQRPGSIVAHPGQQPPSGWSQPTPPAHSMYSQPQQPSAPPAPNSMVMDDPDYIPPMPNTPPLAGARLEQRRPIVLGGSTQTHNTPQTSTSFVMGDDPISASVQPAMQPHQRQPSVPQYQQASQPIAPAANSGFASSSGESWQQQNTVSLRNVGPSVSTSAADPEVLQKAQRDLLDLQARLTRTGAALAEKDLTITQIEASAHQTESALKEMREKWDLQKKVSDQHEEELGKTRAEKIVLEEQIARNESTLAAAKSAYDFEKSELEKKVAEAQAALAAAVAEVAEAKKQLEEEKAKTAAPVDIAPGLDPWFKGSLERYKEMLYTESKPLPHKEKLNVFMDFVNSESRLRGVDLPFGPTGEVKGFPQQQRSQPNSPPRRRDTQPAESKQVNRPQRPQINSSPGSEGFVMVESDDDISYSPGGRPIMKPKLKKAASVRSINSAPETIVAELPAAKAASPVPKPTTYQPFRRNSLETPTATDTNAPTVRTNVAPPSIVETKQPAYKKFAYQPSEQAVTTPPTAQAAPPAATPVKEPIYRPLSAWPNSAPAPQVPPQKSISDDKPVSNSSVEDRRSSQDTAMLPQPLKPKGPPSQPQSAASTPGAQPKPRGAPSQPQSAASTPGVMQQQPKRRHNLTPLEHLASLLPPVGMPDSTTASRDLQTLRKAFASFPSDYTFISSLTKTWETNAATIRSRHEIERRKRQVDLEKRTNELYDDDEIGYGDFDTLESQAKEEELHLKAKEDTEEYDSYGREVFEPVFRKLQDQIGGLLALAGDAQRLVTEAGSGLAALSQRPEDTDLAEAMDLLIQVDSALEERHEEVAKAVQERDRRYKRTQTKPLYAKGDIAGMKRVEKGFELAEKKNEVKSRIERAERCKRLCRIVEANMERGIGTNEDFAHGILAAAEEGAATIQPQEREQFEDLLSRAKTVLQEVYANTTRLLQHFEHMDMELNECEYAVSVASAKSQGDGDAVFAKLEREKSVEDGKLKEEWTGRLRDVDEHAREAEVQIYEVVRRVTSGQVGASPGVGTRLSALEEAKRRNGEL